jgi:hypothetical protein
LEPAGVSTEVRRDAGHTAHAMDRSSQCGHWHSVVAADAAAA